MKQLHRVLYCSRSRLPGGAAEVGRGLRQILERSRQNNAATGLTGSLLFTESLFAQVLEGPIEALCATFERIQCDERHHDVTVLEFLPVRAREFPHWSMAYAAPGPQALPVLKAALHGAAVPEAGRILAALHEVVRGADVGAK